jgi:hypothetical protein
MDASTIAVAPWRLMSLDLEEEALVLVSMGGLTKQVPMTCTTFNHIKLCF